jgi:hypothetical protein
LPDGQRLGEKLLPDYARLFIKNTAIHPGNRGNWRFTLTNCPVPWPINVVYFVAVVARRARLVVPFSFKFENAAIGSVFREYQPETRINQE